MTVLLSTLKKCLITINNINLTFTPWATSHKYKQNVKRIKYIYKKETLNYNRQENEAKPKQIVTTSYSLCTFIHTIRLL